MEATQVVYSMNIRNTATTVFKTIMLSKQRYGMNYIIRILRGDDKFGWKDEAHTQMETYGSLKTLPDFKIKNIISWLMANHYLYVSNMEYGILALTEKAHYEMTNQVAWWVSNKELSLHIEERRVTEALKSLRKSLSISEEKPIFLIFTDYVLQSLASAMPSSITELKNTPGINSAMCDKFGHLILRTIENAKKQAEKELREKRIEKVKGTDYQSVKALINEGRKLDTIIAKTGFSKERIVRIMKDLHETGEIDVKPFIEKNIKPKDLYKATEFFRQTENARLKTAYETLGLDYDILRMCRLYIADLKSDIIAIA